MRPARAGRIVVSEERLGHWRCRAAGWPGFTSSSRARTEMRAGGGSWTSRARARRPHTRSRCRTRTTRRTRRRCGRGVRSSCNSSSRARGCAKHSPFDCLRVSRGNPWKFMSDQHEPPASGGERRRCRFTGWRGRAERVSETPIADDAKRVRLRCRRNPTTLACRPTRRSRARNTRHARRSRAAASEGRQGGRPSEACS